MKVSIANIFLLFFLLLPFLNLQAQQPDDKLISEKKLIKDFDFAKYIIDAHPEPFLYISEEDFEKKFEELKSEINKPLSKLDFYKKVAKLYACLKDGHSRAILPRYWLENKRKKTGAFPLEVHLNNENELFVLKNFGNDSIANGSKIVEINGISVKNFLEKIDPYISYETKHFRNTQIDSDFEKYLYIAFGKSDKTKLEYFTYENNTTTINNIELKDWKKHKKSNKDDRQKQLETSKPYKYEAISDGVGLLTIYAFSAPDLKSYNLFLMKTFKTIKKNNVHSLIIDVRGNLGGWPKIAARLFHYISDAPFSTMVKSEMKVSLPYRNYFIDRAPGLQWGNFSILKNKYMVDLNSVLNEKFGTIITETFQFFEKPNAEINEFKGDCYLLTNRDSFSAASSFAATFKCYEIGTIIGEETGGTRVFFANPMSRMLEKSGVWAVMSTTKFYNACYFDDKKTIKSDLKFSPSVIDLQSELDPYILYTNRIIDKVQKAKRN